MGGATLDELQGYLGDPPALYTMLHRPADRVVGAAVLVGPFAEEKKAAQRALVEAARAWAAAGWDVLRLDLSGTGDSSGEHGAATIGQWLTELRLALATQRDRYPQQPLALVGLRLGGLLAWLAAEDGVADQLVLWEPVTSGAGYLRQCRQRSTLRRELTGGDGTSATATPTGFDLDGFAVGQQLCDELAGLDLATAPLPAVRRLQVVQIGGSARPKKPLADLVERAAAAGREATLTPVAVEAFWASIGLVDTAAVQQASLDWLQPGPAAPVAPAALLPSAIVAPGVRATVHAQPSGDQLLRGVVYEPTAGEAHRLILLLHGWSGYRSGPGQILTTAARAAAAAGMMAVSCDFRGRGESEWEVGEASLNSMIRDASRLLADFLDRPGLRQATLLGLCSGSEVALGAALGEPRVDSLVLWSAPIFSGNFDWQRRARRSRAMLGGYLHKLLLRETWAKLLGGRLNWRLILRAVGGGRSAEDAGVADKAPDTATQMREFETFAGRLLFIYGGQDPETPPSREFYRSFVERCGMPHRFAEVAGANHNFYSADWQREVLSTTLEWLSQPQETRDDGN